jgi:hypothetical protein
MNAIKSAGVHCVHSPQGRSLTAMIQDRPISLPNYIIKVSLLSSCILLFNFVPHLPNTSPCLAFMFVLASAVRGKALAAIWPILLACAWAIPVWQSTSLEQCGWLVWSVSGMLGVAGCARLTFTQRWPILSLLGSGCGYWLWTNFGVWSAGHLYAKSWSGWWACWSAAWPFLPMQWCADLAWALLALWLMGRLSLPLSHCLGLGSPQQKIKKGAALT